MTACIAETAVRVQFFCSGIMQEVQHTYDCSTRYIYKDLQGNLSLYLFLFATMLFLAKLQSSPTGILHTESMNWRKYNYMYKQGKIVQCIIIINLLY